MSGRFELTDAEYARIAPLLPSSAARRGGPWRDHRQVINGILFRVRTGVPWRDVPERYGPWKTWWEIGDRSVRCFAYAYTKNKTFVGSVQGIRDASARSG